jgi:hypothetical protein
MKIENNKNQTSQNQASRRSAPRRRRAKVKEGNPMADSRPELRPNSGKVEQERDFPEEWISIAAYYIWKNDGQPDGQDAHYWERAKAELTQLWKEGNLPTGWQSSEEER